MKYALLLVLAIASCQAPEKPEREQSVTQEEKQIAMDLIQGVFDDIWAGADSSKLLNYHTEDFTLLEHGEVWDNETIMGYIRRQNARENRPIRTNRMDYLWIEKYGESLQMGYHNYADFTQGDSIIY